jgi:hypothetical protein
LQLGFAQHVEPQWSLATPARVLRVGQAELDVAQCGDPHAGGDILAGGQAEALPADQVALGERGHGVGHDRRREVEQRAGQFGVDAASQVAGGGGLARYVEEVPPVDLQVGRQRA